MKLLSLVKSIATFVIFVGCIFHSGSVMACSFGPGLSKSMSEYVGNSDYVFIGEVVYIDDRNIDSKLANKFALIKVDKFLHSLNDDMPDYVKFYYRFGGGDCSNTTHFYTGKIYTIFAKKRSDGYLHVTRHSGKYGSNGSFIYDENQVVDFFYKGQDSYLLSEYCLQTIKQAYDAEHFIGKFVLSTQDCERAIPYYNMKYRTKK